MGLCPKTNSFAPLLIINGENFYFHDPNGNRLTEDYSQYDPENPLYNTVNNPAIGYVEKSEQLVKSTRNAKGQVVAQTVNRRLNKFENLYGTTKNLKELAELITTTETFVCSDSAPLHIAVGLRIKTFVIFGSTDDKKLIPQNDKVIPIKNDCDCPIRPCLWEKRQTTCESLDCLKITADEIVNFIINN